MATVIPYEGEINAIPARTTAAVTGGRFVKITADRSSGPLLSTTGEGGNIQVAHATAAGSIRGVAGFDAAASGVLITVFDQGTIPVEAGGTITAGSEVEVGANGTVVALASGKSVGTCESGATSGNLAQIKINIS